MAKEKFTRPWIPAETDPNYIEDAITACIMVYKKLFSDSKALDYMGITGKIRPMILKDPRYVKETRKARSEHYMEEIEEVEALYEDLETNEVAESNYDIRNEKQAAAYNKDIKDQLSMKVKVMQMRRELLAVDDGVEKEEIDALNIFFIPLSAQEFQRLQNVELHEGDEDVTIVDEEKKDGPERAALAVTQEVHIPDPFTFDSHGDIVEISKK